MKSAIRIKRFLLIFALTAVSLSPATAQTALQLDVPITLVLAPDEQQTFVLTLKKDQGVEISWLANDELNLTFELRDFSGKDLLEDAETLNSIPFVAPVDGRYLLTVKLNKSEDQRQSTESQRVTLQLNGRINIPLRGAAVEIRTVNRYAVKIVRPASKDASYLLIERDGILKQIHKSSGSGSSGYHFADDPKQAYSASERRAAQLVATTNDKTGEGTPDVQIGYFSGGAHCCFATYFYELGEVVTRLPVIGTNNALLTAVSRNPRGGLRYVTADDSFAYWNTSFATSPMPNLVLEFSRGKLRVNFDAMRKPAPTFGKLSEIARTKRAQIDLKPYKEPDLPGFEIVFWDRMLDLIYTGHNELAWQYLDMVWPTRKPGKELFVRDFKERLNASPYWQMIVTGSP